jgi:hypothetical protein
MEDVALLAVTLIVLSGARAMDIWGTIGSL